MYIYPIVIVLMNYIMYLMLQLSFVPVLIVIEKGLAQLIKHKEFTDAISQKSSKLPKERLDFYKSP